MILVVLGTQDKQFTRLLDGVISECKEVDIETLTPNELLKLEGYEKC